MSKLGLTGERLQDLFARCVLAECVQCGMRLTGEEIRTIGLTGPNSRMEDPRLERVRQGYCGRRDCDSYYYLLRFAAHPEVDWEPVIRSAHEAPSPRDETPEEAEIPNEQPPHRGRAMRVAAAVSVLFLLLLAKYIHSGGEIPFLSEATKYEVDPGSVEPWTVEP